MLLYILFTIGAFITSALCGFISIPFILKFCKERQLYDIPNKRKIHKNAVPRLGGIAFMPSMMLAFILALILLNATKEGDKIQINISSLYFMLSIILIYFVGIIDDIIGLHATPKFTVQIIAACLMPMAFLYINDLYGLFGIWEIPYYISFPLTVFIIVFINNAINLIDGIDGLAASISIIALLGFLFLFAQQGVWAYVILIAGLIGVLVPYLYYNMFGNSTNKKKIFMGDSGSLTIGFILGFLFVKYSMDNPNVMPYRKDGLLLAYTLLIVPCFDVVRVILIRLYHKKPLFDADKNHIHHRLMQVGFNQHKTLLIILSLSIFFIIMNMILNHYIYATYIVIIDAIIYILFHIVINTMITRKTTTR